MLCIAGGILIAVVVMRLWWPAFVLLVLFLLYAGV
jgi:hypothetical protein